MCLQMADIDGCITTLVAFVWFFATVRFQMSPQIACLNRCKVTLLAFFQLFSTVHFQMCPQWPMRRCIITQVAFVWFFSVHIGNSFTEIVAIEHKGKSNKCNLCDYASSNAGHLRTHLKTHSGEKSNKCNQYDYASFYASALKDHLKILIGEKSHKCN